MAQQNVKEEIRPDELICIADDEEMDITKLGELSTNIKH